MTVHRLLTPRWLATGGALLLAGILGVALLLQNGGSACAATLAAAPPGTSAKSGKATFYDMAGGTGNCSLPSIPADDLFVALGNAEYAAAAACGTYLDVTGPKGKVRVKVIDRCPECAVGHIDLSRTAFKKIANEVDGIVKITYKTVTNPPTPAPVRVRIKEGSSQYWFAVVIDNHANQLTSVKVSSGGAFKTATRADFNYWIIEGGAGSGPFKIKITDEYGHTATVSKIKLSPGTTQKTTARLTGSSSEGVAAAPKSASSAAAPKKASPSAAPSPTAVVIESTQVAEVPPPTADPAVALAAAPHC